MTRAPAPALAIVLLLAACAGEAGPAVTTSPGPTATTAATGASTTAPGIEVLEVFDGDTLLVGLEGREEEVRLLGINAPERNECFGDEAREALAGLVAGSLRLEAQEERDQFGRLLAYAYAGDSLLNLSLVTDGFALALQDDHPRLAEFLRADERAFSGGRGLWAADACGTPSSAPVTLLDVEYNPAGPDEDDLNGEWVLLGNLADQDADLTGWMLRDESSQNRFAFPAGTLLSPGGQVLIHTGCGEDTPREVFWCSDGPVWNNGGDTALLLDPAGNVAGRLRYSG